MQILVETQALRCTWWACSAANESHFSRVLLVKDWTKLNCVYRAKISSLLLSPHSLFSLRLHFPTNKQKLQRKTVVKKGLAAAQLQSSLQNPAAQLSALQASSFTSSTVRLISQTGRSVIKWKEMKKGVSFFMHIYPSRFRWCQIWILNAMHICCLETGKAQIFVTTQITIVY